MKLSEDKTSLSLVIAAGVILFAALVVQFLLPKPSIAENKAKETAAENTIFRKVQADNAMLASQQKVADKRLFTTRTADIAPEVLSQVTKLASKGLIQITAFRPQRAVKGGGFQILPYFISTSGSFQQTLAFLHSIETQLPKVTVETVQMSSANTATDQVNASILVDTFTLGGADVTNS